jgi:type IV pilus assembly protein PilO
MMDINVSDLDVNNIGNWPIPIKAITIALLCFLVLGAGYWYDTKIQLETLETVQQEEQTLFTQYEKEQKKANSLPDLIEQLKRIKSSFAVLLKSLPSENEIDQLLQDISQTALASGLDIEVFQPAEEQQSTDGVYQEKPISLTLTGTYHDFGKFVTEVSLMERIVTQHNVSITVINKDDDKLKIQITAKVYRYIEEKD